MKTLYRLAADQLSLDELHDLLIAGQPDEFADRRTDVRHPFFAPVTLRPSNTTGLQLFAFSREVSCSGIGLLHSMILKPGESYVIVLDNQGAEIRKNAEVMWCRPAGHGWYLSGFRFVEGMRE